MNFYATSDQHFMHKNIIKYCHRPFTFDFDGVIKNLTLIGNNYNSIVNDDDLVFHLGDLGFSKWQTQENIGLILQKLKGRKILIRGNHDKWSDEYYLKYFESVHDYLVFGDTFFCHYPCYNNPKVKLVKAEQKLLQELLKKFKENKCTNIVHGHIHHKDPDVWESDGFSRRNVCVDFPQNDYFPVRITDQNLIEIMLKLYK